VLGQCRRHRFRVGFPPTSRSLDVGEQERHVPRRSAPRGHSHRMSQNAHVNRPIATDFETLVTRLFRDPFQLRSGLVDLVIGVRDDGGRGHRLAIAGERFVGLIAEHLAEVLDGGGQLWDRRQGYGVA
jgi:hypothetical protein